MENEVSVISHIRSCEIHRILLFVLSSLSFLLTSCESSTASTPITATNPSPDLVAALNPNAVRQGIYNYSYQSTDHSPANPFNYIHLSLTLSLNHHFETDTLLVHWKEDSSWVGQLPNGSLYEDTIHIDTSYVLFQNSDTAKGLCGFPAFLLQTHLTCSSNDQVIGRAKLATGDSAFEANTSAGLGTTWIIPGIGIIKQWFPFDAWRGTFYGSASLALLSFNGTTIKTDSLASP